MPAMRSSLASLEMAATKPYELWRQMIIASVNVFDTPAGNSIEPTSNNDEYVACVVEEMFIAKSAGRRQ